jgi:cytochrome c biogenesis protein CcdA
VNKSIVWVFIFSIIAIIAGFDIYLYTDGAPGNSITQIIVAAIKASPLFAGFVGFIFGGLFFHFFDTSKQ